MSKRYGSHLPVLMEFVNATTGKVLELGCGLYSTPYLYWFAGDRFVSYETDSEWHDRMRQYGVKYVQNYNQIEPDKFSVALIDHAPAERRIVDIMQLKDCVDFFILHDYRDASYNYEKIYPHFKYRKNYAHLNTTVISNIYEII